MSSSLALKLYRKLGAVGFKEFAEELDDDGFTELFDGYETMPWNGWKKNGIYVYSMDTEVKVPGRITKSEFESLQNSLSVSGLYCIGLDGSFIEDMEVGSYFHCHYNEVLETVGVMTTLGLWSISSERLPKTAKQLEEYVENYLGLWGGEFRFFSPVG